MAYGIIKVDTITFTDGGIDKSVSISGLVQNPTFSGNITVTGTISGNLVQGQTISGVTVTGTTAQFTSGTFTSLTGTTTTGTTANFVSGVYTTQISGATITGDSAAFTTITGGTATITSGLFASGTAAEPAISVGTTDNGIYSPGTDQVAISTNGQGQLFVDSNGRIGLNIAAPDSILHISSSSPRLTFTDTDTGADHRINADSGVGNLAFDVDFNSDTASPALIANIKGSEKLRITSDGKLGLGTSSPSTLLHLSSATGSASPTPTELRIATTTNASDWSTTNPWGRISFYSADTSNSGPKIHAAIDAVAYESFGGLSRLEFSTSVGGTLTPAMVIDQVSRVGVGTSSPDATLNVRAGANNTTAEEIASFSRPDAAVRAAISKGLISGTTNGIAIGTTTNHPFAINTNGAERLYITNAGDVGVGTTSPAQLLEVSSTAPRIRITDSDTAASTATTFIEFHGSDARAATIFSNSDGINIQADAAGGNNIAFKTNGNNERARIDSSGRLLVGTTSANTGLDGIIHTEGDIAIATGSNTANNSSKVSLGRRRAAGAIVAANDVIGEVASYGWDGSAYIHCANIKSEVDGTPGANDMPGRLMFSTTADGASSPTERMRIKSTGAISCYQTGSDALVLRTSLAAGTTNKLITGVHSGTGVDTGGTICFHVRTNGNVENTLNSYGPISSDERLKQDIVDAGSQWDDIKAVRLTKFRYKNDPTGELQLGPIAQELEKVSPGLITRRPASEEEVADPSNGLVDGDEVLSFKASILYMKAVKALQEAMERIETLEAKVAALEAS